MTMMRISNAGIRQPERNNDDGVILESTEYDTDYETLNPKPKMPYRYRHHGMK